MALPRRKGDLVQTLSYALRFDQTGKGVNSRDDVVAPLAAKRIVEALKLSRFVMMKKPPKLSAAEAATGLPSG